MFDHGTCQDCGAILTCCDYIFDHDAVIFNVDDIVRVGAADYSYHCPYCFPFANLGAAFRISRCQTCLGRARRTQNRWRVYEAVTAVGRPWDIYYPANPVPQQFFLRNDDPDDLVHLVVVKENGWFLFTGVLQAPEGHRETPPAKPKGKLCRCNTCSGY